MAVAANFRPTMDALAPVFSALHRHTVQISSASTGTLHAQIVHGAPFDIFLSADAARPQRLDERGLSHERFTYAIGRLALWIPGSDAPKLADLSQLAGNLAIANPATAPYGAAAQHILDISQAPQPMRLIHGNSVSQAFQFVDTGNAEAGLVALSLLLARSTPSMEYSEVRGSMHPPLVQQAVRLTDGPHAVEFTRFMQSPTARRIIQDHGYRVP